MSLLKNEYKSLLDKKKKNIKDKDDLEYIKQRFSAFMDVVLNQMDSIMNYKDEKINELEKMQNELDARMAKMQQVIDHIEKDIYDEDGFDFEIVCPYCNYEFVIDLDENKSEIECPECKNMIELDWTGNIDDEQSGCGGSCHGCHGCGEEDEEDDDM